MIPQNVSLCIRFLCGLMVISSAARLEAAQQTVTANPASTGLIDIDGGKPERDLIPPAASGRGGEDR